MVRRRHESIHMVKDGEDETSHSEEGETHILCEFHHWVEGLQEA